MWAGETAQETIDRLGYLPGDDEAASSLSQSGSTIDIDDDDWRLPIAFVAVFVVFALIFFV